MVEPKAWFAGVDWASEAHHVCVVGGDGSKRVERIFRHGGAGLAEMVEWIAARSGGSAPDIPVAIEVPHGPVVESLMDHGFAVYAINPKQLDRFRDRFSPAGAKDDSLDARVLADALRTDLHHFRRIDPVDPAVIELRAWSRIAEELTRDRVRLSNRVREQLWRYYPQILEAVGSVVEPWFLDLWAKAPTPAKARRVQRRTLESLLKRHRIRRITADQLQEILRAPAIAVAPGTTEAAVAHIQSASERLRLVQRQLADAKREVARLIDVLAGSEDSGSGQPGGQRDVTVLSSLPGVGQAVLATRCSPRPRKRWRAGTTRRCGVLRASRPSHGDPASTSSSCAAWPPTHVFATQSTIGHGSRSSAIPSARPSTPHFAPAATATPAPSVRSPTACLRSPAPCSEPRPATGLNARQRRMRPDLLPRRGVTALASTALTNGGESPV